MPQFRTIAIVGVGLIGGSIGLAVRQRKLSREVVGIGRSADRLDRARSMGAIDRSETDVSLGVREADIVIVCTPVALIASGAEDAARSAQPSAILTDAGSTKAELVARLDGSVNSVVAGPRFVGSHPLAGDHRSGCEFARADLFVNRTVVVTPTSASPAESVATVRGFWESLGSCVVEMSPEAHDRALAITSHLPHLVASALSAATPREHLPLTATGWQDTTRLAAADPELWRQIFGANRAALIDAVERFDHSLAAFRDALRTGDEQKLLELLEEAKQVRDALGS
jgi:prephenate dehydrogenase